jgi:tetratricopeptide (TPR) repeat protein
MASFRLAQCRTYSKIPKKQAAAEKNLTLILGEWETLSKALPKVPLYRQSLGEAHRALAELRMETGERLDEAKLDLEKSRDLLTQVVAESPKMPGARGELGRTYLALGHLAKRQKSPADDNYANAVSELKRASELAPQDFSIRRDLDEANAAIQH